MLRRQPKGLRAFAAAELRAYLKRKLTERPKRDALLATRAWAPLHLTITLTLTPTLTLTLALTLTPI